MMNGPHPRHDAGEPRPRPEFVLVSWVEASGRLRLCFLRLCRRRQTDTEILVPIGSESLRRWSESSGAADDTGPVDRTELHIVLAVEAERPDRLLGGFCLEYSRSTAVGTLTGLLATVQDREVQDALEARLLQEATALAHRLAEGSRQDAARSPSERPRPCVTSAPEPCPLTAVFAYLTDARRDGAGWKSLARLERLGVRVLQVERRLGAGPEPTIESRLAMRRTRHGEEHALLFGILPRHGFSEDATLGSAAAEYVTAQCAPPDDSAGPWTTVRPCSLRPERPALEIERFAITLHYISTPHALLPPATTAAPESRLAESDTDTASQERTATSPAPERPADEPAGVFDSFERDILSYAYRDTRPFKSTTAPHQPPGGYAVTVHVPNEIAFTSEGQRAVLWCAATTTPSGRDLPLRVLRNRTVFPESGIQVLHLTLLPDPDAAGFVFNEYDLIKIAKLCEGGEGFQAELVEFHAARSSGFGDRCPRDDHQQSCRFVEHHDFFHQESNTSFDDFPHGCDDWRYCEPRAATIQIMTGQTRHAEQWADVYRHLNLLAEDRVAALKHLRTHLLRRLEEPFPSSADRLIALGGILQSLLDFERIDAWELGDVLEPIDYSEGYLLYLHKGMLLTVAESDRAAEVESSRAYVGINPYLLGAHTVLLHNEQVLRLARAELRSLQTGRPPNGQDDRALVHLRQAYLYLDDALFSDYLPNVFHYPTERTIYDEGHRELGLLVEREALGRQFERLGRTVEAADATMVGTAQVRLAIVALFVGLFAAWQVVQPIADYGQQALVSLTSGTSTGREIARIRSVQTPATSISVASATSTTDAVPGAQPEEARVLDESSEAGPGNRTPVSAAVPANELRVESVQQFELIPLALFGVVSVLCTLLVWPILRRQ
jgi:hypothetical protein